MEDRNQPKAPRSWNPAGVPSIGAKPEQKYTYATFPSIEGSLRDTTGVSLPFVDLTRGPGSLVSNTAVLASHPLLKGLLEPEAYAENEMVPPGLTPTAQDHAYTALAAESGMGGQEEAFRAWANEPKTDSGNQVRSLKDLLAGRAGR